VIEKLVNRLSHEISTGKIKYIITAYNYFTALKKKNNLNVFVFIEIKNGEVNED
jgi:hypothetical protein